MLDVDRSKIAGRLRRKPNPTPASHRQAGVLLPLPAAKGASYGRWVVPASLTAVALIVASWFAFDAILDTLTVDIGADSRSWGHILLHTGFAVSLLVCGGMAFIFARNNWQRWRSEHLTAELALRASLHRMQSQFEAVGRVGQAETLLTGDIQALAQEITKTAAGTIGCERVNIWRFNDDESELHCVDLYETTPGRHSAGLILREAEFRNEFEALKTWRYIDADDPLTDARLTGYIESYIKPLGITSMLDTAIRVCGRNLGVICFEHVGRPHRWQQDEIAFAGQLADKFAFGLMNSWRREAEANLRTSEASLAAAQVIARLGSWEMDVEQQQLTWSAETYRIFGVDRDSFVPTPAAVIARIHPDDRNAALQRYGNALANSAEYEGEYRIVLDDGSIKTIHERGRSFFQDGRPQRTVGTLQDVTERKAAEVALAYRDRILHAVTVGTARLLEEGSLAKGMPRALKILGKAIGVDRVLVFESNADGEAPPALRYCWEAPDVPVRMETIGLAGLKADFEVLRAWGAPLEEGHSVVTHRNETSGPLRDLFDRLQNKSVLLMPIFAAGHLWGVIGLDACKAERAWTTIEIETLATFARVIGSLVRSDAIRRSLESSEERFRAVSEAAKDAILMIDAEGQIAYWNRAAERILGYGATEAAGRPIEAWLVPERHRGTLGQALADLAADGSRAETGKTLELAALHRSGAEVPVELSIASMNIAETWYAVGILRDVSERKQAERRMVQMARTDELTGLSNRRTFVEAAQQAIARARRTKEGFAVLYLDLDHFKDVNDILGHPVGDELLRHVSSRLTQCIRETDAVARFGGDEFAVLATNVQDPAGLGIVASRILAALRKPFKVQGNVIRTGASIGIATYGSESPDPESLLSHADIALYRAKQEGRGIYCFFTESMDIEVRERVRLAAELREPIAQSALHLAYQPQVDSETGRIVGLEALLRWQHPRLGFVPPDKFVATAETTGQISALGHWVLETACGQVRQWLDDGLSVPGFAINVSALQFKAPEELEQDIENTLAAAGLTPDLLEIELTETALMQTSREHRETLERLRAKGYRLAIDDFGTGYSSLDYLRRLPVDRIKIDRSFIGKITSDAGDATIVKAAINIAQDFGLTVIAEGVETADQLALLHDWGCREVQGYYFAKPMPAAEVAKLLRQGVIRPEEELVAAK
ncbi:MAG: EAL domain-containing protein [Kiloniellaceae bacterium]